MIALVIGTVRQSNIQLGRQNQHGVLQREFSETKGTLWMKVLANESNQDQTVLEEYRGLGGCGKGQASPCTPPLHIHPKQKESFTVISGTVRAVTADGSSFTKSKGDTFELPANQAHTFWIDESSTEDLHLKGSVRPPLNFAKFFRNWPAIFAEAGPPPFGDPLTFLRRGGPVQLPMTACAADMYLPDDPLFKLLGGPAACSAYTTLGHILGLKAFYTEYEA